jgi:hypothetical protein
MRRRWLLIPISLTFLLSFLLLVPFITQPGAGVSSICDSSGCVRFVQYESISYAYGGWGAVYDSGVNTYNLYPWICNCPIDANIPCCVPPYAAEIWPVAGLLLIADLISIVVFIGGFTGHSKHISDTPSNSPQET